MASVISCNLLTPIPLPCNPILRPRVPIKSPTRECETPDSTRLASAIDAGMRVWLRERERESEGAKAREARQLEERNVFCRTHTWHTDMTEMTVLRPLSLFLASSLLSLPSRPSSLLFGARVHLCCPSFRPALQAREDCREECSLPDCGSPAAAAGRQAARTSVPGSGLCSGRASGIWAEKSICLFIAFSRPCLASLDATRHSPVLCLTVTRSVVGRRARASCHNTCAPSLDSIQQLSMRCRTF